MRGSKKRTGRQNARKKTKADFLKCEVCACDTACAEGVYGLAAGSTFPAPLSMRTIHMSVRNKETDGLSTRRVP